MADGDVPADLLRACYEAFAQRRATRGARSVRTRRGYARLRAKYQPRLRLLQDNLEDVANTEDLQPPADAEPSGGEEEEEEESEEMVLRQLVGVFFDARVKRLVLETIWPLAHHGSDGDATRRPAVPEWQELEQHKYFAFMFKTMLWLFPGLPSFEAQEQAESDWSKDCEFDAFGTDGLSFEGFMVSLIDLALACTDSTVDKCVEFLTHLTKWLETSLPMFRVPTANGPCPTDDETSKVNMDEPILWKTVPLEKLFPCPLRVRPQFIELKVKLSSAPIVLMVLAGNERQLELQLSTSAKVLVREQDHRCSVRRNTMQTDAQSHFIEVEKHILWTFRSFPGRPTLVIIPSGLISKRTLSLYACCRLLESHEHSISPVEAPKLDIDPLLTLFTAVQDPFPLLQGPDNCLCGRIDRQSSRLFVIDHRARDAKRFQITFKTSLIHNTSSAGGAGAAAVVSQFPHVDSNGTAECKSESIGGASQFAPTTAAHSFIFVVKVTTTILECGPQRRRASTVVSGKGTSKSTKASVPAQWFTTLCGANENKTIYISSSDAQDDTCDEIYYVYVFTLHGFYFEATYECCSNTNSGPRDPDDSMLSFLVNPNAPQSRLTNQHTPGPLLRLAEDDEGDYLDNFDGRSGGEINSKFGLKSVSTSANLLHQLLQLRRQRQQQLTAQPPPNFVGGSKISSVKVLTAAAGLRAKFLRARAVERRTRSLQNEAALQGKIVAKLLKFEARKRVIRGDLGALNSIQTQQHSSDSGDPNSDVQAKATEMVNFFKEMAAFQPTQHELDEAANEEAGRAELEDALLDEFADLFDDGHALQNILDAEKWLSSEEKATRRQSILEERVKTRRESMLQLHKQQVPQLHHQYAQDATSGARKKSASARASEDYYSTAMLINQLMREAGEEQECQSNQVPSVNYQDSAELDHVTQMAATWTFAARSSSPRSHKQDDQDPLFTPQINIAGDLQVFESVRGDAWLDSHCARNLAVNERLQQLHSTFRSPLVPTRQDMRDQEQVLPWNPVWEVQPYHPRETASPFRRSRPKTASSIPFSPRPPPSEHPRNSSASHSATIARQHTRRIRSARVGTVSRKIIGNPKPMADDMSRTTEDLSHVHGDDWTRIFVSLSANDDAEAAHLTDSTNSRDDSDRYASTSGANDVEEGDTTETSNKSLSEMTQSLIEQVRTNQDTEARASELARIGATATKSLITKKRKKKRTAEEKRFDGRVQELLSISPLLQSFSTNRKFK